MPDIKDLKKDGIYFSYNNFNGYREVPIVTPKLGNETEEHYFLKNALIDILINHGNCKNIKSEYTIGGIRFDVYGENGVCRHGGEIGKLNCPSHLILKRLEICSEYVDIILWIPFCDECIANFDPCPDRMERYIDYLRTLEPCQNCSKKYIGNDGITYIRHENNNFGVPSYFPVIFYKNCRYNIYLLNLKHMFAPEIYHKEIDEIEKKKGVVA